MTHIFFRWVETTNYLENVAVATFISINLKPPISKPAIQFAYRKGMDSYGVPGGKAIANLLALT